MTVDAVDITVPGLIVFTTDGGQKVELYYDARAWNAQREDIPLTTPEEEGLKASWHHRTITRIRLDLKSPERGASPARATSPAHAASPPHVAVFQYTIVAK